MAVALWFSPWGSEGRAAPPSGSGADPTSGCSRIHHLNLMQIEGPCPAGAEQCVNKRPFEKKKSLHLIG